MYLRFFLILLICSSFCISAASFDNYHFDVLTGQDVSSIIPAMALQYVEQYHNYPYLFDGPIDQVQEGLQIFVETSGAAVAVAYYNDVLAGFITGIPLAGYQCHFSSIGSLFAKLNLNIHNYYYFADVLIGPEHQNKSLATYLFQYLEQFARQHDFQFSCLVSESYETHPLKPTDYREVDPIWYHYGYRKTDIIIELGWPTIQISGEVKEQVHELPFWTKELKARQE